MNIGPIYRREMRSYFSTTIAYVFIVIFLLLTGIFTFYVGGFFARGQADLEPFFTWHPWLYLFLAPALGMRLWAEERKTGTFELLLTLPVSMGDVVLGKFLAAWSMIGLSLALTFPIWVTVNILGDPDNGVILMSYIGSLLMAGAYLAISACISAVTRNQVIAFVVAVGLCFAFLLLGFPLILDFFRPWMPVSVLSFLSTLGFLQHFQSIVRGVLDVRDLIYFATFTLLWLYAGAWVVDHRRS
jgi:ABC-2 type transport system permease protein